MADSFADLWNSTASPNVSQPPRKLGTAYSSVNNAPRSQRDAFSLLASPRPTPPISVTSQSPRSTPKITPTPSMSGGGADAFSDLLSGALDASSGNKSAMTIAQRAAHVERERRERLQREQETRKAQVSAWDGLDSLANSVPIHPQKADLSSEIDDWDFTRPASNAPPSQLPQVAVNDDWGLGDFAANTAVGSSSSSTAKSNLAWDFDEFESSPTVSPPQGTISRSATPGDFDFGDREDRLLDDNSNDEDDLLGDLAKPADALPKRKTPHQSPPSQSTSPPLSQNSRAVSPPPHILGQIVEMGFSPQQARVALAATETGLDVQSALETLLANGAGSDSPASRRPRDRPTTTERSETRESPRRRPAPARHGSDQSMSRREREAREASLQEQADKLLAQASEMGMSMFNRANAFWKEGKDKVQKVYEERAAASRSASGTPRQDGRPKWMQDPATDDREESNGFGKVKWDDDDDVDVDTSRDKGSSKPARPTPPKPRVVTQGAESKFGDLLSDAPAVYQSPFRRGKPGRSPAVESPSSSSKSPARASSPVQLTTRQTVSASASALATVARYKAVGGEKFKLGQYSEAESAYTSAISVLPASHLLLVQLFNNRALARLKTGNHAGAIEDCSAVIGLIGAAFRPAREAKVAKEEDGAGVDLADGLVKAWKRRAEAYEGKEKWEDAKNDWEAIIGAEWAGKLRNEAIMGAGRCRRMAVANADAPSSSAAGLSEPSSRPLAAPKLRKAPALASVVPSGEALERLRKANMAAEAEDQAKHDLKDSIDSRITAWKAGKETNLRALIASVDTVLWPELGWQKVGMHELVTPSQVKIRYMKAIAKVHPDKLNSSNTTVDQRMIANGVFSALNDAWNAFKQ